MSACPSPFTAEQEARITEIVAAVLRAVRQHSDATAASFYDGAINDAVYRVSGIVERDDD